MPLPSKFLFDGVSDDHVEANANTVLEGIDALTAADGWHSLVEAIEEHIRVLFAHLEISSEKDEQVRGKLAAYRDVLDFPRLVVSKAQKVIDSQE